MGPMAMGRRGKEEGKTKKLQVRHYKSVSPLTQIRACRSRKGEVDLEKMDIEKGKVSVEKTGKEGAEGLKYGGIKRNISGARGWKTAKNYK